MSAASMLGFAIELHRRFEGNALPELRGRSTEAPGSDQPTTLTLSAPLLVLSGVICLPVIAFVSPFDPTIITTVVQLLTAT